MPRNRHGNCRISGAAILVVLVFTGASGLLAMGQASINTYHYDTYRTGWNQNESILTPANVGNATFGLLQTVTLDDQVDAQPLVIPGVQITAGNYQGTHDVVYVATENNTVYAINVHTGTVLLSPNFGTPVSYPLGCNNNGPNVGINSTPVIDPSSNTLYVMVYTQGSGGPTYTLHALDLGSLTDKVTPQVVTASHPLANGTTFSFNATYQRQRPALLLANGSIYAGFGSFCDFSANLSRGWLLGWTAGTLAPFPSNNLNNQLATSPNDFFLSSIWMSGYGPAADDTGSVLFVTGNSDYSGTTYDGITNIQESVVKVSSTLESVEGLFTPDNQSSLDQGDQDFGSGGVLVLPDQPGALPHLAVAAGKDGNMYFMDEDDLGGYSPMQNNVLGTYQVGDCWCGPSYYVDPTDGLGRVVSSGGYTVRVWKVQTSPTVSLTNVTNAGISGSIQDPGFFTSISSNGTSNPIIWALSRPATNSNGSPISLYAFNPESGGNNMTQLFHATAGAWPNVGGNANLVPVVANGLVFVASHQLLQIFGLTGSVVATSTTLSSSVNPSVFGNSVLFTATVSAQSGGGIPTGTVTFYNGATALGAVSLSNGSAQYSTTALPAGSNSITAVYGGNASYSGSTSSPLNQVVQTASVVATTTTLSSSVNPSVSGKPVVFSATVSPQSGTGVPTGKVSFYNGTTAFATVSLTSGSAKYTTSKLPPATSSITAVYGGSSSNSGSTSGPVNQVVTAATTTTLTSSTNSSAYGQSVILTAAVSSSIGSPPNGESVSFMRGTLLLGTGTLSGGSASFQTSTLTVGTYEIKAVYGGAPNFSTSTSKSVAEQVTKATTTTALASSLNPSNFGQSVTFTATVAAEFSGTPTGSVVFKNGTATLGTVTLSGGMASYTTTGLAVGMKSITAVYGGSSSFIRSTSAPLIQTVN